MAEEAHGQPASASVGQARSWPKEAVIVAVAPATCEALQVVLRELIARALRLPSYATLHKAANPRRTRPTPLVATVVGRKAVRLR